MYVDDIDDVEELKDMLYEANQNFDKAISFADREQTWWDVCDIQERLDEIEQE
jgi:hypothetical protein